MIQKRLQLEIAASAFLTCQTELQLLEKILLLREKFSVFSIITNTLVLLYVMKRKQAISFIFTSEGNENVVTEQDELHTGYAFQQRNIVMYDADYCEVQSFSGRIRFAREFGNTLYTVIPGDKFKTYYLATMEELQQIKLR